MGVFTRRTATGTLALAPDPGDADADEYPLPQRSPSSLTGSTSRFRADDNRKLTRLRDATIQDRAWQARAWYAYENVPEIHFAFNLIANLTSRIRFYPAAETKNSTHPSHVNDTPDLTPGLAAAANAAFRRLASAPSADATTDPDSPDAAARDGIASLVRAFALNLSITGEAYLVQTPAQTFPTRTQETWRCRSIDEVIVPLGTTSRSNPIRVRSFPGQADNAAPALAERAYLARIWRRNPRYSFSADSSMRAVLDLVDEMFLINETFRATARSRLNSGLLFVPDGLQASRNPDAADGTATEESSFEDDLIDAMMTPVQDPGHASAVVPLVVRGAADLGEKIKLIHFERTFDPSLVTRAEKLMERILSGLDLPKELVQGIANSKYANSIQIEDSLLKAHIEPLAQLIADAIAQVYLRPYLKAAGFTDQQAARATVWYDASPITTRPNRGADAISAYDRYAINSRALREAVGFNDQDAPTATEVVLRLLQQKGPITPELSEALMRAIAPMMMEQARQANEAGTGGAPALPPEVLDALGYPPASPPQDEAAPAPDDTTTTEAAPPPPAETAAQPTSTAPPRPPKPQGPRAATPATTQNPDVPSLLPPTPRERRRDATPR